MAYAPMIWLASIFLTAYLWRLAESIERCKKYPKPKNGHVVCDSLFRLFCTPECNEGFTFEFKPAVMYMCGPITGKWFTYPEGEKVPWPDCVRKQSSKNHAIGNEMTSRRAQIAATIHGMHFGFSPPKYQQQPVQLGRPDARYLQMFNYFQRAQQQYSNNQVERYRSLDTREQHRQLESLQRLQQRQKYLQLPEQWHMSRLRVTPPRLTEKPQNYQPQIFQKGRQQDQKQNQQQRNLQLLQQQWRTGKQTWQPRKLIQQSQSYQPELINKERKQRQVIDSTVIDKQINVQTSYPNSRGNNLTNRGMGISHIAPPGRAELTKNFKTRQIPYKYFSPYTTFQSTYEETRKGSSLVQRSNLQVNSRSTLKYPQPQNRIFEQNKSIIQQGGLLTVSQERTSLRQQSNLALNSQKDVKSQLWKDSQNTAHAGVVSQPTNQIASTGLDVKLSNEAGRVPIGHSLSMLSGTAKTRKEDLVHKSVSYEFPNYYENAPNFNSNQMPNTTSKMDERPNVANESNVLSHKKLRKKEKLFYFPIKRDTLVQILLTNLQEKFKSLDEKRNINSTSQRTSRNKENVTKLHVPDASQAKISNYGYGIKPPSAPAPMIQLNKSETFDSSRNILYNYFANDSESHRARTDSVYAPTNLYDNPSAVNPNPGAVIEEYRPIHV